VDVAMALMLCSLSIGNAAQFPMKMLLGLSEPLPSLVESKFKAARGSEALIFSSTKIAIIRTTAGVPVRHVSAYAVPTNTKQFQLRYCPALGKKPVPRKDVIPKNKFDPFENPSRELFITDLPSTNPSHILVLNKYPVIANHFILATKTNKKQTHVLEEDDLAATYAESVGGWSRQQAEQLVRLLQLWE
jgi:ATP adenylyltransferase